MKWPAQRLVTGSKKSFGMYEEALRLDALGVDLIHLEFGRPHADTPAHIKEAAKAALDAGIVHYGDFRGTLALRAALAAKLRDFNGLDYDVDEVLVTNGLTHASFAAFMAAIDPGDEVILLEPYYPQHVGKTELAGGRVVTVPLDAANGFAISRAAIAAAITPRTRMIVLINPANPTGRVYTRAELQHVADLAIAHDLIVLSDEVYEHITYDDAQHVSIASLPGMRARTISCFAFTKAYSMDGWRIGYLAADRALMPALMRITMTDVTHVNVFVQEGALAAVNGPPAPMHAMVAADRRKRDIVVAALNTLPGVTCATPQATIYAFPDISGTGRSSTELAMRILNEAHVVTEAGCFYGPAGEGHLRVCFGSVSEDRLIEAMDRLTRFFGKL
ncbi:pyridoxal phosphate-dependent aminotransferase [Polymorphobacter fuscus]|uniref:aspartate transaminase n=1 Tax=Sandarakinorhabdus fusca TaxID=1439888 RepID=A0A7C9KUW1_9SPHN|nr:aminotransferase class I/II-fold pyridoxal phosphate-dependent enzyme [Polymorphobacter fuscus]KAB7648296.1 aminotransferase class I/II-fold pyridoxal phosphate-dependent enzyme [Polymorphobacter fuscus]MQT15805.1 aminotransferase class I/II-fold pyridoxal phosphate-dependent enzyme [Polymorphobacter fuscus]NJC07922.1 aspartate aminotransferase [Polymorphobacter fuscus]